MLDASGARKLESLSGELETIVGRAMASSGIAVRTAAATPAARAESEARQAG